VQCKGLLRVVGANVLPVILDLLAQQLQCLRVIAFALQQQSQVLARDRIAVEFSVKGYRPAQQRFGIGIPVLQIEAFAELRKTLGDGRVMFAEIPLANGE
jgi:hypothetical protein